MATYAEEEASGTSFYAPAVMRVCLLGFLLTIQVLAYSLKKYLNSSPLYVDVLGFCLFDWVFLSCNSGTQNTLEDV